MKKDSFLLSLVLLSLTFSCNEQEVQKEDYHDRFRQLYGIIYPEALAHSANNFSQFISVSPDNAVTLDQKKMSINALEFSSGKHFHSNNSDYLKLADDYSAFNLTDRANGRINTIYEFPQEWSYNQVEMATNFLNNLKGVADLSQIDAVVSAFYSTIDHSHLLSLEEKDVLYALGNAGLFTRDFIINDGLDIIYNEMISAGWSPRDPTVGGRTAHCSVNMGDVWAGAVVGLASGAVRGAVIGCSGGTIAFPLLGTATGCVGGAVMGGALGFIGGSLSGIAASLLRSC